jgi:hypothetical protein
MKSFIKKIKRVISEIRTPGLHNKPWHDNRSSSQRSLNLTKRKFINSVQLGENTAFVYEVPVNNCSNPSLYEKEIKAALKNHPKWCFYSIENNRVLLCNFDGLS